MENKDWIRKERIQDLVIMTIANYIFMIIAFFTQELKFKIFMTLFIGIIIFISIRILFKLNLESK